MAARRGVRSSSRRTTPAPQLAPKTTTPQAGRTTRQRGIRSASRDIEEPTKPTRRSARPASVDSVRIESEAEGRATWAKRKAHKEAIADLTVVEEIDTQLAEEDAPPTQPQASIEVAATRRSLGAVSEMSGTTAISSFTLVEAETLNPRFMHRHLAKLHDEAVEFLNHLAPEDSHIPDLHNRIREMQNPDSDFTIDYNDFDQQLSTRLAHYRGESQKYIHIRAVHAALFGAHRDSAAAQTGLDLILYQVNLIIFAKDMINTDRNDKHVVGALRELVNSFPAQFLPALTMGTNAVASVTGDSALLQETFDLALELRTQLAILYLQQGSTDQAFNPDAALEAVFFNPSSENSNQLGTFHGWNTFALGSEDSALPDAFAQKVEGRVASIRQYFWDDELSQERGESVNLEHLVEDFPWAAVILRLLEWVRDRSIELQAAIQHQGGATGISDRVKAEKEHPTAVAETNSPVQRTSLRKSRTSFGRNRRRSSKKFDPNAEVNEEVLNKLLALESGVSAQPTEDASQLGFQVEEADAEPVGSHQQELHLEGAEAEAEAEEDEPVVEPLPQDDDSRHQQEDVHDRILEAAEEIGEDNVDEEVVARPTEQALESSRPVEVPKSSRPTQTLESSCPTQVLESTRPPEVPESSRLTQVPPSSRPPQSTNDFVNLVKETRTTDKENRSTSLFDRQANAQRVDFGDGFGDSQPTLAPFTRRPAAGPSRKGKEPQHSSLEKRKAHEVSDGDEDDDVFDAAQRSANVERQRTRAPKRVCMDPSSSEAPTSHQPQSREHDDADSRHMDEFPQVENDEPSEPEAPDMTEEVPPRSTYQDQVALARADTATRATRRPRRVKRQWSVAEENALIKYMGEYPKQYARILAVDKAGDAVFYDDEGGELVERRTQVDLKDKARVMAKNMIKSRAGLRPGFRDVITPAIATQLRNEGLTW